MYKITLDSPTFGKGEVVTVAGLGELTNGETLEVDDEKQDVFRQMNSTLTYEKGVATVKRGPTFKQAFKNMNFISVEYIGDKPEKDDIQDELPQDENPEGGE